MDKAKRGALARAKARLDLSPLYPRPVSLRGVRIWVAPWLFRLPWFRRFDGYEMGPLGMGTIVQYWRSFDHLEAFARDQDDPHSVAWRNYWKRVGTDNRTGIWHETYLVRADEYEAIYANMPPFGLGKAGTLEPLSQDSRARLRIKQKA